MDLINLTIDEVKSLYSENNKQLDILFAESKTLSEEAEILFNQAEIDYLAGTITQAKQKTFEIQQISIKINDLHLQNAKLVGFQFGWHAALKNKE